MIFLYFILAALPLTWAVGPIGLQAYKIQKDCQIDCFSEGLGKCECQNARAFRCAEPNTPIFQKDCAPQIPKYPTAPSTLEKKTRKYSGTSTSAASSSITPRPSPPPPPQRPSTTKTKTVTPALKGPRTWTSPHPTGPTKVPESPLSQRCGSRGFRPCPDGEVCVDNPFVEGCFTALDCPGYCARLDNSVCGPVFEVACPIEGQICVHDPREDCFGKVCPGTCVFLNNEIAGAAIA